MSCYDSFHVGTIFYLPKYLFTVESFCIRPGIIQPRTINKHTNSLQSYKKQYVASQDREHLFFKPLEEWANLHTRDVKR